MFNPARRKLVIGAWKAYLNNDAAMELAKRIRLGPRSRAFPFDIGVCPSFVSLVTVEQILRGSVIGLGGQNVHWEGNGAFTGQVTAEMLLGVGCQYVIIGHSELRAYGESDDIINTRIQTATKDGLTAILCVGETRIDRQAGSAETRVREQLCAALRGVAPSRITNVILAYEPVWAIKSGRTDSDVEPATVSEVREMHTCIRELIAELYDRETACAIRILYGGSISANSPQEVKHTADLITEEHVDGLLVGSASTRADYFLNIIRTVDEALQHHAVGTESN